MKMRWVLSAVLMVWGGCALAADRYVTPTGSGTGASWTDPMNIQASVAGVTAGATVWVTNGTYTLSGVLTVGNFKMKSFGSDGNPDRTNTIINGARAYQCFILNNAAALVEGFTITNGSAVAHGGGVNMSAGTLRDCLVIGNSNAPGAFFGGGVYAVGANCMITNCDVIGNATVNNGGGLWLQTSAQAWNCRIVQNRAGSGGGIHTSGGRAFNCSIISNTAGQGGGVWLGNSTASTLRNCMLMGNTGSFGAGVGAHGSGGMPSCAIENCTIVANVGYGIGANWGGAAYTVLNTIAYHNTSVDLYNQVAVGSFINASNSCAASLVNVTSGSGNITTTPTFVNRAGGDYRLRPWSAGVDQGLELSWMSTAVDLDGNPRLNGSPDMGAYETAYGAAPDQYVARGGQTPVSPYTNWMTAASNIEDAVNAAYGGNTVVVSNGIYALSNEITVGNLRIRSFNNGALDRDGTIIDGNNYPGKSVTNRCFRLTDANALVEGITITNGFVVGGHGGGVTMTAGTLRNCLVTGNTASNSSGGGVYATGSGCLITNCDVIANAAIFASPGTGDGGGGVKLLGGARVWDSRIMRNRSPLGNSAGGGVNSSGGWVVNCQIISNTIASGYGGGGVWVAGAGTVVRNCLIVGNGGGTANSGAGVGTGGGSPVIENCTIVGNLGDGIGGYYAASTYNVANTISYNNSGFAMRPSNSAGVGTLIASNCCATTTNFVTGGSGNITNDPRFANAAVGNYRLNNVSPCINNGVLLPWMTAGAVDLDGNPRISPLINGTVDMGAYEFPVAQGSVFLMR